MRIKLSGWRWVMGGLLAMVFAGGCATGPQEHRAPDGTVVVNGTTYWDLDPSAGSQDINADNYYYHRVTVAGDGTRYEEFGYYITYPPGTPHKKVGTQVWVKPLSPGVSGHHSLTKAGVETGWHTYSITHPPGLTASHGDVPVECGAVIRIIPPSEKTE